MKNRLISIFLCILILLASISVVSYASGVIGSVDLTVEVPFHGNTPIKPTVGTDNVSIYAYEWLDGDNLMSSFESFEGGKTYTLKVRLTTLSSFSGNVSVRVNSLNVTSLSLLENNTHILFEKEFYVSPVGYTLSFDSGWGSGSMTNLTGKTAYNLPECSFVAPSGKEFKCWMIQNSAGQYDLYNVGDTVVLTKNTTVIAAWVDISSKTKIYEVEATSNISEIAVLYGDLKVADINITKGSPAYITDTSANFNWQKKVGGVWETQYSGYFTPGEWRASTQLRVDGDDFNQYELGSPVTLTVDGKEWTMNNNGVPTVSAQFAYIAVYSSTIVIENNPTIHPPVEINALELSVNGYRLGGKVSDLRITVNNSNVNVSEYEVAILKDTNGDGMPDDIGNVGEYFDKTDNAYIVAFKLTSKPGYIISNLTMSNVTCANGTVLGSYNLEDGCFSGVLILNPFDTRTVSFASGGGSGTMSDVIIEKGKYTLPSCKFNAPKYKQFNGWAVGKATGSVYASGSSITVTEDVTLYATWKDISIIDSSKKFTDVDENKWFKEYVDYAVTYGIFSGTSESTFSPNDNITRAQFVQVLANLEGVDTSNRNVATKFTDVPSGKWFTAAVKWASENGVVNGVGDGKFDPNANVTREQMCVMLVNYAKFKSITLKTVEAKENFADDASISKWAKTAVYTCQQADIVNGKGANTFDPKGTGTRAEASVIFTKFHKEYLKK